MIVQRIVSALISDIRTQSSATPPLNQPFSPRGAINEHVTFLETLCERITDVLARAAADGVVVEDLAIGVQATQTRAGIVAFLIDAGEMRRAFRADETFWPTVWRCALVTWTARAHRSVVHHAADAVRAAR